jgi:hypothetical protein
MLPLLCAITWVVHVLVESIDGTEICTVLFIVWYGYGGMSICFQSGMAPVILIYSQISQKIVF